MSEIKAHTKTYVVVDEKNIERIYSNIASVKIWRKKLILRSEHGDIIASFSSWKSSSILPSADNLATTNEDTDVYRNQRKRNYEAAVKNECPILRGYP